MISRKCIFVPIPVLGSNTFVLEITCRLTTSLSFFCNEENYDYFYTIVDETMFMNINH